MAAPKMSLRDLNAFSSTDAGVGAQVVSPARRVRPKQDISKSMTMSIRSGEHSGIGGPSHFDASVEAKNVAMKSAVIELEDLIETTGEVQTENVRSSERLLTMRLSNSTVAMTTYAEDYRFPTSSKFTRDTYIEQLSMKTSTAAVDKNVNIVSKLRRLLDKLGDGGRRGASSGGDPLDLDVPLDDTAAEAALPADHTALMKDNLTLVTSACAAAKSGSHPAGDSKLSAQLSQILSTLFGARGDTVARSLFAMDEIVRTDVMQHVRTALAASQDQFAAVLSSADNARAALEAALSSSLDTEEEISRAGAALEASVKVHETALRAARERMNQVLMDRGDDGNLRSSFDSAHTTTVEWIAEQRHGKKDIVDTTAHDVKASQALSSDRAKEHERATQSYSSSQLQATTTMEQLQATQEGLWREVEERVMRIAAISAERQQVVLDYMSRAEAEWKRRRFYDEYRAVHESHLRNLELVRDQATHSIAVLDELQHAADELNKRMDSKDLNAGLDVYKKNELQCFASLYPGFTAAASRHMANLDAGSIICARSAKVAESSKMIAITTRDPDAETYATIADSMAASAADMEAAAGRMAASIELWHNVALQVAEAGKPFGISIDVSNVQEDETWRAIVDGSRSAVRRSHAAEADHADKFVAVVGEHQAVVDAAAEHQDGRKPDGSSPPKARKNAPRRAAKAAKPGSASRTREEG